MPASPTSPIRMAIAGRYGSEATAVSVVSPSYATNRQGRVEAYLFRARKSTLRRRRERASRSKLPVQKKVTEHDFGIARGLRRIAANEVALCNPGNRPDSGRVVWRVRVNLRAARLFFTLTVLMKYHGCAWQPGRETARCSWQRRSLYPPYHCRRAVADEGLSDITGRSWVYVV